MGAATAVTPGYFRTMRDAHGARSRPRVVATPAPKLLVSDAAARQFWPGQSPLGKRIGFGPGDTLGLEVIGVVGDTHSRGLAVDAPPMIYIAYAGVTRIARTMSIVVRGRGDAGVHPLDDEGSGARDRPDAPLFNAQSVSSLVEQSIGQPRLNTTLLSFFAWRRGGARGDRHLRGRVVLRHAAHAGDRRSHGAWRAQRDVMSLILREGAALATIGVSSASPARSSPLGSFTRGCSASSESMPQRLSLRRLV